MFYFVSDLVDGTLDTLDSLLDGELPSRNTLKQLASAGISVVAMSEMYGIGTDVVERLLDD